MIINTEIEAFIGLARQFPVLDVRSPGEYAHAHIPGAHSLPLFSDDERKVVGTAYKQQSRETAIKIGLDFFGVKMRKMVEDVEAIVQNQNSIHKSANSTQEPGDSILPTANCVLVHCWRGGMRSAGVAWLLDLYGFKVHLLNGGYKAFRNWSLQQFSKPWPFNVLGGYTGSGKTNVLQELALAGQHVIDLEELASHKGSAFGGLGKDAQPSQEMFENKLAIALNLIGTNAPGHSLIWIEDESRRIGNINLPEALWNNIRDSPLTFLDIPGEQRLDLILREYGTFKNELLVTAIMRIRKRLGGLATKQAVNFLIEDNKKECFRILLGYYDKFYEKDLQSREANKQLHRTLPSTTTDAKTNAQKILSSILV